MYHWAKFYDSAINFYLRILLKVCQIDEKNIRDIRLRKVSQHNTPRGSGLADCHLVWTKNSCEDGSGYYFKSKVSRNFNSTLVTSQRLNPKLAEHDLDQNVMSFKQKLDVRINWGVPEIAKETTLAKMCKAGKGSINEWWVMCFFCFFITVNVSGKLIAWNTMLSNTCQWTCTSRPSPNLVRENNSSANCSR